ncbi:RHS repeat-associated core domain-containing protein [Thiogranum longum]|uniref:RHS repeat-associated core domain-containing protein n=1 Tax=Thiogranum longum TaxID=1537524 RepID=UPI001FB28201|nr:RHS repeat-associated core domain-containing protein [Thiogranum longum]
MGWPRNDYHCPLGYSRRNSTATQCISISTWVYFEGDSAWCERNGLDAEKNLGSCNGPSPFLSNPIHSGTGNKFQQETDINGAKSHSPGFTRFYNSFQYQPDTVIRAPILGHGWRHNYMASVRLDASSSISTATLQRSDGKTIFFTLSGNLWVPDADVFSKLDRTTDENGVPTGWQHTTLDNTVELYDLNGILISITDVLGDTQYLSYDTNGRLDRIDTDIGEYLQFGYDASNRIATITDHTGRIWGYRYDASNNLEYVDNADGTTKQYHYEDANFPNVLTGITDERGIRYATWTYDAQGRASRGTHAGNAERVDITYNTDGTRTVTNSLGQSSTYTTTVQQGVSLLTGVLGPGCSTCGGSNTSYSYDPASNKLLDRTENGLTTAYGSYNLKGQYGYKIEAQGTPEQHRTDYTYDARFYNKIATIIEPSVFASDPTVQCTVGTDCKVTTYTYDNFGNRTSETINGFTPSGMPVTSATTWAYTAPLNQVSQIDGPRTDVADITQYRYYPNDTTIPVGTRARLREIEDANGVLTRSNIQYTATGKVSSEARPNGLTLSYTYYPGNDRLQTLTESDGTSTRTTRWTYLATGEVQTITTGDGSPDATTLTFGYDDARRLTRITDGLGNHIDYTLDTEGNRLAETTFDANGTPSSTADDVLTRQLTQTFDIYNRLDTSAQANETTNPTLAPDGTLDNSTDGNGRLTEYSYDALRRLTQVQQDFGGTDPTTANATTQYNYDVADRLTTVTDPVNGNTTYAYDDLGNLITRTSPDTGTTTFVYDPAGNLIQKTAAVGTPDESTFTYTYDALNRLTRLDAPGTVDDITYTYDTCLNGRGRLCAVTYGDPAASFPAGNTVHYQYNAFGDITFHQGSGYSYDAAGRLKTLTYPGGATLTYSYDAAGQVSQLDFTVNGATETLASNLAYAPFGPLTNLSYGNGLTLIQSVDSAYRLSDQTIPGVLERSYLNQYDANGNRTGHTDALATPTQSSFSYDPLNRLDTGSGPFGARDYDYDKNGNRTQLIADSVITASAYAPNSNRLDTLGAADVILDAHGNTTGNGVWSYSYNPHNRLIDASEAATLKVTFAYNGLGQRIRKTNATTAGNSRHFLYGTNGELLAETDDQGNLLWATIYLNGQPLARYSPDDDSDGIPNHIEADAGTLPINTDDDGDTLTNLEEWFSYGTDSNTVDSDGDGINDNVEIASHTDPTNPASVVGDGDLNHDGQVNLGDLVLLYQYVLGTRAITPDALSHGDMNRDGLLNTPDVLLLQKLLLTSWFDWGQTENSILAWLIPTSQAALPANSGVLYYLHNDPLGTPLAMTDAAGTVVWTASYDPFGKATVDEDVDGDGNSVTLNVRFPGQYYDSETRLHYNINRYYDPTTGRYLTSDPLGVRPSLNTYAYVDDQPINWFDVYGLAKDCSYWGGTNCRESPAPLPENGNVRPGFGDQDFVCTGAGARIQKLFDNGSNGACLTECCAQHDSCYELYECNASSWRRNIFGADRPCQKCNKEAINCFLNARNKKDCGSGVCGL